MPLWRRITNVFRGERLTREIDEEMQAHIAEAVARGRNPAEARQAFGSPLRRREESRDIRLLTWLDSLRADAVFGWRQLAKRKVTSVAAVLSLALAIGSCTAAFRLIDALFLRPLPVTDAEHLFVLSWDGTGPDGARNSFDSCSYPFFRQMRAAAGDEAEFIAVSYAGRMDVVYGPGREMEKAYVQYVSGWMFDSFGLRPAAGRLLDAGDDVTPGAHPYAVLSYDYWTRRFGRDPAAIGRTFRMGSDIYQVVGAAPAGFTGTEPGSATDVFVPTMMNAGSIERANSFWFRTFVRVHPGVAPDRLRGRLDALYRAHEQERAKGFTNFPKHLLEAYPAVHLYVRPAAAGVSGMQQDYRRTLAAIAVLVALVLWIACANVANLMTAQAAARAREMALRVSIGAGRWRLAQLVLVESALLALISAAVGAVFAWRAAPFVVARINPADNPARLDLQADWRLIVFGVALALTVTMLFGLAPALRASAVRPSHALKGGDDPHSRRRLARILIAGQAGFCFLVLFIAGLFVASFERLSHESTGFSAARVLTLDTVAESAQEPVYWEQVSAYLRTVPGVESAAVAAWPLLSGTISNNFVSIDGAPPGDVLAFFLGVSPGWLDTMKIPLTDGRDLRADDQCPGPVIVNHTFARQFFGGEDPVGRSFETAEPNGKRTRFQIVGLAGDARYRSMREAMLPEVYVPLGSRKWATLLVRAAGANPTSMEGILRRAVPQARPGFRVSNIRTQQEINDAHTVRERLLAMLALFFGIVAVLLAGVGLYGVLDYTVVERRREIGIRLAIGAGSGEIARRVTADTLAMVAVGSAAGLAAGLGATRWIETLLYHVKPGEASMLAVPAITIAAAALLAALPAAMRAVRTDPAGILREE